MKLDFINRLSGKKKTQISNFMKILPVEVELFYADGRKDRRTYTHDDDNSRISYFYERTKKIV